MRLAILVLTLFSFPAFALCATIEVPKDYTTIQAAIDASINGDIVFVSPGTYVENIDFKGKAITVKSKYGPDVTVIDGVKPFDPDYGSVVIFKSGEGLDSVLDGFTLTRGSGTWRPNIGGYCGGGVFCWNFSSPTIVNNIITNNHSFGAKSSGGGGIIVDRSSPLIRNNLIKNNYALGVGGGVYISSADSKPTLINNTITINTTAGSGGGVAIRSLPEPILMNNIIYYNAAVLTSPELYLENAPSSIIWHCDIKYGWPGVGNIDADPLFANPGNEDFHLMQDPCQPGIVNPCVDAGYPSSSMINGSTRTDNVQDFGVVDLGYHYPSPKYDYLNADQYYLQEAAGGLINLSLTAGQANANRQYIILGSVSGTAPGLKLPGGLAVLPLNWDNFTSAMIDHINTPYFVNFAGVLDSSGNDAAVFNTLGPMPSGLTGTYFSFAFALRQPWDFVSNPVSIEIVK